MYSTGQAFRSCAPTFCRKAPFALEFFPVFSRWIREDKWRRLPSYGASYRVKCLQWLFAFVQAVDATEVIVAANNVVFPNRNGEKATDQLELLEHLKLPETYKGIH